MLETEKKESKTLNTFQKILEQISQSPQYNQAGLQQQRKCLEETTKDQLASQDGISDIRKYWYHT